MISPDFCSSWNMPVAGIKSKLFETQGRASREKTTLITPKNVSFKT
jgi:hypothetical protein